MSELLSTALVTGGSRGIGRAVAQTLAAAGYQIFLTYVSKPDEAEQTARAILAAGGRARAFRLDVGDSESVAAFFRDEVRERVELAVLVNNAGITKDGLMLRMKDEDFDRVLGINLRGAFLCLREAAKIMSKQRYGRIINISSVVGQMGNAGQVNYSAAKAGLIGMTKSAAKELASRSITVNAVAPGLIDAPGLDQNVPGWRERYSDRAPLGRIAQHVDIADVCIFCCSELSAWVTGETILADGGVMLAEAY